MKEIYWKAFLRLDRTQRRKVLIRLAGDFNATALILSQSSIVRRFIEHSPMTIVRFHAAVLDVIRDTRGPQAAELLKSST